MPGNGDGVDLNLEDHARIAHTATMPLLQDSDPKSPHGRNSLSAPTPDQEATLKMASIISESHAPFGRAMLVTFLLLCPRRGVWPRHLARMEANVFFSCVK